LIDSEGYVFCQKLKAEGLKKVIAASQCINQLSENVLTQTKEFATKRLLHLNKLQHADMNGKFVSPDFIVRHAALGANITNAAADLAFTSVLSTALEITSNIFEKAGKRNKDLEGGVKVQKVAKNIALTLEVATLLATQNYLLAIVVVASKLTVPALNKLDEFALEHGQDWKTKSGGVYVR
jgi:hypothetical protein